MSATTSLIEPQPKIWRTTLLVFLLALLPRVLSPAGFVTVDEAMHWLNRVAAFVVAIAHGRFADTILTGHPGVTTMWLGGIGQVFERLLQAVGLIGPTPSYQTHLALLRLPMAVTAALGLALAFRLLRRLTDERVALLAALLWATNPFLIAHQRLLHLDGLLTTLMLLALLSLLAAFFCADGPLSLPSKSMLALAGAATGLALLTKVPSVLFLPIAAPIAGTWVWYGVGPLRNRLRQAATGLALWLATALATAFLLWPALWVAPLQALERLVREAVSNGNSPHGWGNFFMGTSIADPGPWFYLATLAFRLTPWALIGLVAWALLPSRRVPIFWPIVALLFLFVALFSTPMMLAAKKFDRYLLPVFPVLDIIAALGLVRAAALAYQNKSIGIRVNKPNRTIHTVAIQQNLQSSIFNLQSSIFNLIIVFLAIGLVIWYHPYYLSYYNPLLGGGTVAQHVLPIGWGEGMDQAADWLNQQPDLADGAVASAFQETLSPYVNGTVFNLGYLLRGRDFRYLVLYADQVQRRTANEAPIIDAYFGKRTPLHIVQIHGIDYAWIYQVVPQLDQVQATSFADQVDLVGYRLAPEVRSGEPLVLDIGFAAMRPPDESLMMFVHLIGSDGRRYGQLDTALGDERFADGGWQPGRILVRRLPIPLNADAPPGNYRVVVGVYRPDGTRLPISQGTPANPTLDGEHAVVLTSFTRP